MWDGEVVKYLDDKKWLVHYDFPCNDGDYDVIEKLLQEKWEVKEIDKGI
jgi:hypothetical protein